MYMITVLVHVYNTDGVSCRAMGGRILAVYDIIRHEGALYVPPSGASLVSVECVVELCVVLVLVYSLSL